MASAGPAAARDLLVPTEFSTLQAAIDASADGDRILVAPGTYSGPGNKDIDPQGRAITIASEEGAAFTTIDVGGAGRAFLLDSGEGADTVIQGFTIVNGHPDSSSYDGIGGGILCYASYPTLEDLVLEDNSAIDGGGIFLLSPDSGPDAHVDLRAVRFYHNYAERQGGAMRCHGFPLSITLVDGAMVGNSAGVGDTLGLYHVDAVLKNLVVVDNSSGSVAPGVSLDWCSASLDNVTIAGNTTASSDYHGALSLGYSSYVSLEDSIVWGNSRCNVGFAREWSGSMTLDVSYSLLEGGTSAICEASSGTVHAGDGILNADPEFTDLAAGDVHLETTSAAVDSGSTLAYDLGIDWSAGYGTAPDGVHGDSSLVDLGFHYSGYTTDSAEAADVRVSLNEIMFNPSTKQGDDGLNEYIELINYGLEPVDARRLTLSDKVSTDTIGAFGSGGAILPPDGLAMLTDNVTNVYSTFGVNPDAVRLVVGDDAIGNGLNNDGDTLTLWLDGVQIDQVSYRVGGQWNKGGVNGKGEALERIDPAASGSSASNWCGGLTAGYPNVCSGS